MRYALLIYASEQEWAGQTEEQSQASYQEYMAFTKDIVDRGLMAGGEALQPTATATTVRVRDGETLTTDGPFVAVKEALGGYLFFEADDIDAAIDLAARIPAARMGGAVEVRPIAEW